MLLWKEIRDFKSRITKQTHPNQLKIISSSKIIEDTLGGAIEITDLNTVTPYNDRTI